MHSLIPWAGFLGAWLLVAGPVWQAGVRLGKEEFERERFMSAADALSPPERVSSWWWLLPPLRLYLSSRSNNRFQEQVLLSLPDEEYDAFSSFMAKARGWMLVGLGGLLILSKETWELVEGQDWDSWVFWLLFLGMALLAAVNAAYQSARQVRTTARRTAARPPSQA